MTIVKEMPDRSAGRLGYTHSCTVADTGKEQNMDNLEKVEKLRERANVTYEEAKAALEENNWDLLDAMVALEKAGKTNSPRQEQYSTSYDQQEEYIPVIQKVIEQEERQPRPGKTIGGAIRKFFPEEKIEYIKSPGTLEGGDVMMVDDTFYVGLSARTNEEGIRQLGEILSKYGLKCVQVPLKKVLHLKTGVNYLEHNNMLVSGEFIEKPEFAKYNKVIVPEEEAYGANCIWVNETVIVPEGYPSVLKAVQDLGYKTLIVDTSEFRKIDGGLSCLSLRFWA
jgi:dimethylargininase